MIKQKIFRNLELSNTADDQTSLIQREQRIISKSLSSIASNYIHV